MLNEVDVQASPSRQLNSLFKFTMDWQISWVEFVVRGSKLENGKALGVA